jgi:hypothetical protein
LSRHSRTTAEAAIPLPGRDAVYRSCLKRFFWTVLRPREAKQCKAHLATLRSLLRGSQRWKAGSGSLAAAGPIESE